MAYGSLLGRMFKFGLYWCFAWCLAGALTGFLISRGPRDPRAIPHEFMPFVIGIPSAVLGGVAGVLFVLLSPAVESRRQASVRGLAILGAVVGAGLGFFFMRVVIHSVGTVVVCTLFGAALGAAAPWMEKIS